MAELWKAILLLSCIGTGFAALLMCVRPLTQRIFSSAWHYYMWLFVLLAMVVPLRLTMSAAPLQAPEPREVLVQAEHTPQEIEANLTGIAPHALPGEAFAPAAETRSFWTENGILLSILWLVGFLLMLLSKIVGYILFLHKIRRQTEIVPCPEIQAYTNRKVLVRKSDKLCSPLLIGVIKPTLLLPEREMSPQQLQHVLAHEMTHLRRQDILYKWFVCLVKCVHWFQPAVYLIGRQINMDCEISCDLAVVRKLDKGEEKSYMETIMALLMGSTKNIPLTTGMTGSKKSLKKRFLSMKNRRSVSKKAVVASVIIAVLLIGGILIASGLLNGTLLEWGSNSLTMETDPRQDGQFNMLIVGVDERENADTVMLLAVRKDAVVGLSIPRNMTFEGKRVTEILRQDGEQGVVDCLRHALHIPITYYVKVSLKNVQEMIDHLGGLTFEIPMDMTYEDPYQDLYIDLKKGVQQLTGEQVCHLLQYRSGYADGEFSRALVAADVLRAFYQQKIAQGNLEDLMPLCTMLSDTVETNYAIRYLRDDLHLLKGLTKNNLHFDTLPGQNVIDKNGRYVYQVNEENAEEVLALFRFASETISWIQGLAHQNEALGIEVRVPEYWKSAYETVLWDHQLAFYHKDIFQKYGKGFGMLFSITKGTPEDIEVFEQAGIPYDILYWDEETVYLWSEPTDVQHPVWSGGDEEDALLAKDYEAMREDLPFIKSSFVKLEKGQDMEEQLANTRKEQAGAQSLPYEDGTRIKSTTVSDGEHIDFEQLVLMGVDAEQIQQRLQAQGIDKTEGASVDLREHYAVRPYAYEETQVISDENGNISLYFSVNNDNLFEVAFSELENNQDMGRYGVLANNQNAYTFSGFEKNKVYSVKVQGQTKNDWAIDGSYIIY